MSYDDCLEVKRIIRTDLCCIVYHNCTQLYAHSCKQFFQVGLLDRALISLGLAVSLPSTSVS